MLWRRPVCIGGNYQGVSTYLVLDALGDKIAIMAHGNLVAVGNGLHLKNRYGAGIANYAAQSQYLILRYRVPY